MVCREIIEAYVQAVQKVLMEIIKKMGESLGVKGLDSKLKEWPCQFRINKYSFTPETVGSSGVQIHTDSGFLTLLQDDDNVGGLQVMNTHSSSFVDVPTFPGSLFANLGDLAHVSLLLSYISLNDFI